MKQTELPMWRLSRITMRRLLAQLVGFVLLMQVLDRLSLPVVVTATSVLLAVGCLVFLASSPGSRPDS